MMFSPDEGESWPDHAIIAHDPSHRIFYWDHRPVALPNGDRAGLPAIRFRVSKDEGATWPDDIELTLYDSEGQPSTSG